MKRTKKLLAVILALCMLSCVLVVVAACQKDLSGAKQTAIAALDTYAAGLKAQNVYSDENLTLFDSKVAAAKEAINAAETQEAIDKALADARAELASIPVDVQGTNILRAKNQVASTLADLKMRFTYTSANETQLNTIVTNGNAALDALIHETDSSLVTAKLNEILAQLRAVTGTRNKFTNTNYSSSISHQWNPHTYESAEESDLFAYIVMGLYEFVLNDTKDGYDIVPEMAAEMAVDVTSDYVGQYGVVAGDTGKVWKVALNPAAKWENGDLITADDYVYSMKALLSPDYRNYRASSFTSGDGEIYNAANYVKQGGYGTIGFVSSEFLPEEYVALSGFTKDGNGVLQLERDGHTWDVVLNLSSGGNWGEDGLAAYAKAGYFSEPVLSESGKIQYADKDGNVLILRDLAPIDPEAETLAYNWYDKDGNTVTLVEQEEEMVFVDGDDKVVAKRADLAAVTQFNAHYAALLNAADSKGLVKLTEELATHLAEVIAILHGTDLAGYRASCEAKGNFVGENGDINYADVEWQEMAFLGRLFDEPGDSVAWDTVGFKKTGEYEITFAFVNELEEFYLYYGALGFPFLVHEETYERCLTETDGLWTSSYCTSMETTMSYGPYKMSEYQMDRRIAWTVNENWYGWTDGKHDGKYQTTDITIDVVANQATALNMFLQGKFDAVSLVPSQMTTYRSGPNTVYTPSTNTWKFTFNSSKEALAKRETTGINKTLLSYSDFRKAIGLSIDKEQFVAQNSPASMPGFGLINNMYVYDYNTGASYRGSDIAKQVLVEYYGLEYGEGKEYATLDAAYDAMTGYSREQALALFRKAFADAKAAGDYHDGDVVTLEMLMYSSDQTYIDVFNFADNAIKEVIKGTELEGKIALVRNGNGGEEFYDVMDAGETDIIMSAWGGGQFDPFGTISCYLDPDLYSLHEYGANIGKSLTLTIGGTEYTMSLTDWSKALNGSITYQGANLSFKTADFETRLYILAQLEKEFLNLNAVVPLWYVTGASMHSYKINYGTDTYVNLVGFGGIREMTYNYTDAEWATWVAAQLAKGDAIDYTQKPVD